MFNQKLSPLIKLSLITQICVERCLERGKNSGRTDDNVESLTLRIKTYNESTLPIIQHFDSLSMVKRIEAAKTEEEVI